MNVKENKKLWDVTVLVKYIKTGKLIILCVLIGLRLSHRRVNNLDMDLPTTYKLINVCIVFIHVFYYIQYYQNF